MSGVWDAVVIGAGPAGASAAARLAEGGAAVLLVDEQREPGGQIHRAIERNLRDPTLSDFLGPDQRDGAAIVARLRASSAATAFGAAVWRVDRGEAVWTRSSGRIERHATRHVVVATGAIERPFPVEGWTLPGVFGIGGLQILLKSSGLVPDGGLVLAGTGPLLYYFASQCVRAGLSDLVVLGTASSADWWPALRHLPGALTGTGPRTLALGAGLMASLLRHTTFRRGVGRIRILGAGAVEAVEFTDRRGTHRFPCRVVGLHQGVVPNPLVPRSLDCAHDWDAVSASFRPRRGAGGETSVPGVFVAGDGGGIVGARASAVEGERTAVAILARLGRLAPEAARIEDARLGRRRAAEVAVRPFLDRLYRPAPQRFDPSPTTVLCRCEAVDAATARTAVDCGADGPGRLKTATRMGMGPCRGALCGATVTTLLQRWTEGSPDAFGDRRMRAPVRPITLGELAAFEDGETPS